MSAEDMTVTLYIFVKSQCWLGLANVSQEFIECLRQNLPEEFNFDVRQLQPTAEEKLLAALFAQLQSAE